MDQFTRNRLTILGSSSVVGAFAASKWLQKLKGKHPEPYYLWKTRHEWWFDTGSEPPLSRLQQLSREWPKLLFFLEFDNEQTRVKGLAKARNGKVEQCQLIY